MPIGLKDEHEELRSTARRWLGKYCSRQRLRELIEDDEAHTVFWRQLGESGWLGIHLDDAYGGQGFGTLEVAVVLEELGRALAPGPILPTILAGWLIQEAGSLASKREFLRGLADGSLVGTIALAPGNVMPLEVEGGYELKGTVRPVIGARHTGLICLPVHDRGHSDWYVVDTADVEFETLTSIDPTRTMSSVTLDSTFVPYDRRLKNLTTARVRDIAATLAAAEAAGIAAWCVDAAVEYAKVREQFGRPIGQFQAVKHRCADDFAALERATCAAWDAAISLADVDESPVSAATAGLYATESAYECAKDCIQTLGGVGCTWDHDAHLYLKRATALRHLLGGPSAWSTELARRMLGGARRHLRVDLPAEAAEVRREVRAFIEDLRDLDEGSSRTRMAAAGYICPHWPKPWGQDADAIRQIVIQEEFRAAGVRVPSLLVGAWVLPTLIMYGSEEQQQRWIPPTLNGDIQWCQMFSEPGAGSDLASLQTKAKRVDGGWRVSGHKIWTTHAHTSDYAICLARTDPTAPKHKGIGYFLVDMAVDGIEIHPLRELTGHPGFNEVFLRDVFLPDDALVGEATQGWELARNTLANERVAMDKGATTIGLPEQLIELVAASAGVEDSLVLDRLGRLLADAHTLALLNYRKTLTALRGAEPGSEASLHKLLSVEHNQRLSEWALELFGPAAATRDGLLGYWIDLFLGMRAATIAGGTSEIQRNVIAERILGLPQDP